MDGRTDGLTYGWTDKCMDDGWMDGRTYGLTYEWMDKWMNDGVDGWMHRLMDGRKGDGLMALKISGLLQGWMDGR